MHVIHLCRRRLLRPRIVAVAAAAALIVGCDDDNPAEPTGPTLAEVQEQVFAQSCTSVGCHAGSSPAASLSLEEGNAYDNLVNVASTEVPSLLRVDPGNADDSYLYIKLIGGERMAPGTFQMPIGQELPSEDIELVRQWINEGAER